MKYFVILKKEINEGFIGYVYDVHGLVCVDVVTSMYDDYSDDNIIGYFFLLDEKEYKKQKIKCNIFEDYTYEDIIGATIIDFYEQKSKDEGFLQNYKKIIEHNLITLSTPLYCHEYSDMNKERFYEAEDKILKNPLSLYNYSKLHNIRFKEYVLDEFLSIKKLYEIYWYIKS